jgi:hypothetical protein
MIKLTNILSEIRVNKPAGKFITIYYEKTDTYGDKRFYYIPKDTNTRYSVMLYKYSDYDKNGNPMYWISSVGFENLPKHIQDVVVKKEDGFNYIPGKYIHVEQGNINEIQVNKPILKRFNAYASSVKTVGGFEEYLVTFPNFNMYMVLEDDNMVISYNTTLSNFLDDNKIPYENFMGENKVHIAVPVRYFNLK